MLTADLLRVRVRGDNIHPNWIDPNHPNLKDLGSDILECFHRSIRNQLQRQVLQEELKLIFDACDDLKLARGLAKLCLDRSVFESPGDMDSRALREEVFQLARTLGPIAYERGLLNRPIAEDVFHHASKTIHTAGAPLSELLYADLKSAQHIQSCDIENTEWLLHRYNTALVQGLLLRATTLTVDIQSPSAPRMKQLFRHIKFHRLIHHGTISENTLSITLDGPLSLFKQSSRYGMQLANFFPALLLQKAPWTLEANVLWTRAKYSKRLRLSSLMELHSHYLDTGAYRTREVDWFKERFEHLHSGWSIKDGEQPIDLGGKHVIFPDFTFEKNGRTAHLDITGFWQRTHLSNKLEWVNTFGPKNLVLAISPKMDVGEHSLNPDAEHIVLFKKMIDPKKILAAIERVAE